MELKPLPLNTLNRRDRHNAERQVLAAALEACEKIREIRDTVSTDSYCLFCDEHHVDEALDCPSSLADCALDMAKVKGVL